MFSYAKSQKARAPELIRNLQGPLLSLPINPPHGHRREEHCFLGTEIHSAAENCFGKNRAGAAVQIFREKHPPLWKTRWIRVVGRWK
jgi:hypothetical protein